MPQVASGPECTLTMHSRHRKIHYNPHLRRGGRCQVQLLARMAASKRAVAPAAAEASVLPLSRQGADNSQLAVIVTAIR